MIKSLIIFVLALALAAGAFLSRPNSADFKPFIKQKLEQKSGDGFFQKMSADAKAEFFVQQCTFKDRLLWVSVQRDNKTIFTGAFNHWWGSGDVSGK